MSPLLVQAGPDARVVGTPPLNRHGHQRHDLRALIPDLAGIAVLVVVLGGYGGLW